MEARIFRSLRVLLCPGDASELNRPNATMLLPAKVKSRVEQSEDIGEDAVKCDWLPLHLMFGCYVPRELALTLLAGQSSGDQWKL